MSIYVGEGIGRYQFYQGELSTIAWEFNNHSGVTKEMNPNQSFSGLAFGSNFNFNRLNIGLDWARKNNRFGGEYEFGGVKVTDNYVQCINSYYINFGIGNKIDRKTIKEDKDIVWRIQTEFGFYNFKLKEELKGTTNDFDGVLGNRKEVSVRMAFNVWIPITQKLRFNVMPYFEFDTSGGFVEILIDRYQASQYYNINHYGINLNLDYAF